MLLTLQQRVAKVGAWLRLHFPTPQREMRKKGVGRTEARSAVTNGTLTWPGQGRGKRLTFWWRLFMSAVKASASAVIRSQDLVKWLGF